MHIWSRFPGDITPRTSVGMDARLENCCQQNCKMTSCCLRVALLKQNDETKAFKLITVLLNMLFKWVFSCPSAGVPCQTHLGRRPLHIPCSRLTCSIDFDGHGASFRLKNEWITGFPLMLWAMGKQGLYYSPTNEREFPVPLRMTFWPAGFKGFDPLFVTLPKSHALCVFCFAWCLPYLIETFSRWTLSPLPPYSGCLRPTGTALSSSSSWTLLPNHPSRSQKSSAMCFPSPQWSTWARRCQIKTSASSVNPLHPLMRSKSSSPTALGRRP